MKLANLIMLCLSVGITNAQAELCDQYDKAKALYVQAKTDKTLLEEKKLEIYAEAVNLCPDLAEFQFAYGESLQRAKNNESALVAYKKALMDSRLTIEQRIFTQLFMMKIYVDEKKRVDAFIQQSDLHNLFKVHQDIRLAGAKQYFEQLQLSLTEQTTQQPFDGQELTRILSTSRNLKVEAPEISYQIPFGYNQNEPLLDGVKILHQASTAFLAVNPVLIRVIGHTDLRGDAMYNQRLSEKRAKAVVRALEKIQPKLKGKMVGIGKGESEPLSLEDTEAAHQLNRRVSFIVE